jgi:hypothetical protein
MKRILLVLGLSAGMGWTTAIAGEGTISPRVLESFNQEFSGARNVSWVAGSNYYRAAFVINGQNVFAYYTTDGELMSLARYISSQQLPIHLLTTLKNDYDTYWISDLFEVNNNEGTSYYVTLENAETKLMLRSGNGNDWSTHSKRRKI